MTVKIKKLKIKVTHVNKSDKIFQINNRRTTAFIHSALSPVTNR